MDLFTYLMAKKGHNSSVHGDLFSYLLGKGQSGTPTYFEGTNLTINNTTSSKIKNIQLKGNTSQDGTTDNLFDNTWENGGITPSNGTNNGDILIRTKNYIRVFPNHLYSISRTIYSGYMFFRFYDKDYNYLGYQSPSQGLVTSNQSDNRMNSGVSNMTFTIVNENVAYMRIGDASNDLSTIYTLTTDAINLDYPSEIKVVKGDNSIVIQNQDNTQQQTYPINLPIKNFVNIENSESGGIDSNGNLVTNIQNWRSSTYINVMPNTTYNFSMSDTVTFIRIYEYNSNQEFISPRKESSPNTKIFTFTTGENTKYLKWTIYISGTTITQEIVNNLNIQIEEGSTASSYWPFGTTPIELCKIGDYQDKIYYDSGKWYLHKEIGKYVIKSFVSKSGGTGNIAYYTQTISDILKPTGGQIKIDTISNCFESKSANQVYANNISGLGVNTTGTLICGFTLSSTLTTLELANTWVANNNINVYYPLDTSTNTEITDTTLIEQLNNLLSAKTYTGQTNVYTTYEEGNEQMIVGFTALIKN